MNSGNLNDFFEQILHTERSLSSRNTKLRQLKEEIQSCVRAVQEVCQEAETRQGELAVRNVKMVDEEVEARLFCLREAILEDKNRQLLAANQTLASELETAKSELDSDREWFLEELREFGRSYDLAGAGARHREQLTKKKVATLQDEVLLLETELAEFECEREEVRKLEQKLVEVEKVLAQKEEENKLLEKQVADDEEEIRQLKEESESLGSKLSTDPEILKLQKELEESKDCPEERMYHSLQKELEELQRLCYHQQMRQHMSRRKSQPKGMGGYNPYVHQYDGSGDGRREGGSGGMGGTVRERESQGVGAEGEEEGWDDELEAAELASFQESLSVSEMEWMEDEEEEEGGDDPMMMEEKNGPEYGGNVQREPRERKQLPSCLAARGDGGEVTAWSNKGKTRLIRPPPHQQPTSRAVRTVVKEQGGERLAHLARVTDSPAMLPVRKSSGQSIYKTPGQQESYPQIGVSKTIKRVRFRY